MSQMGYAYGASALILYGALGAWSVYLLVWLYLEFKARTELQGKVRAEGHILQYHEVIGGLIGRWGGKTTYFFVILSLAIASVIQLIASSSDLYYANSNLNKREWQYIVGAVAFLAVFVPDYAHFRSGVAIGILTTTITSLYMFIAALSVGQVAGIRHTGGVSDKVEFLTGATNILFAFGGHGITIEILESMKRPSRFKFVYLAVCFYTLCITLPSTVAVYWAYGDILLKRSNAFSVLPPSRWRTVAILSMVVHQAMGFVVFTHPVFLVCEKAVGVHTKSILRRVLVRLPIVAIMWFLALAVPFFGPINSVMGALLVTSSVYIIPLAAFIITYSTKSARQNSAVQLPLFLPSWSFVFFVNAIIILWIVIVGIGLGGWASITNFVRQINTFGFFDECFQCPSKSK
nr:auxin transporter-like protein 2 isoform X2 [Physcomitrium patens]|eukprot:XP_024369350.1 auxin transporter-like protein 2 isoform X2 [Physcomitrella patens]